MLPALIIFLLTYLLMLALPQYRPFAALGGAALFLALGAAGLWDFPLMDAARAVDFNVLLMMAGTMGTVSLFIESRMPARLAELLIVRVPNVKWAVCMLALFAGVISAFVDNVATVLMVAPVGLAIARKLKISPVPVLISIAVSSNLQGAATLVGDTTSILLGGLTMSIILLPTIIRSTEEALLVVPQHLRDASLSVGANQSQTIFKIVLPCAVPGILTGVLLGIGRVIGESAALIYTMGTFINDSPTLLSQGTSLAVQIWSIMSGEQPNYELACAISIIILFFVLILNFAVKIISKRFSKAWY